MKKNKLISWSVRLGTVTLLSILAGHLADNQPTSVAANRQADTTTNFGSFDDSNGSYNSDQAAQAYPDNENGQNSNGFGFGQDPNANNVPFFSHHHGHSDTQTGGS